MSSLEIGNYIHSRTVTYEIFGISPPGARWHSLNAGQSLSLEKRHIKQLMASQKASEAGGMGKYEDLEKILNAMIYGRDAGEGELQADREIRKAILDIFNAKYGNIGLGSHLGVYNTAHLSNFKDEGKNTIIKQADLEQLRDGLKTILGNEGLTKNEMAKLNGLVTKLNNYIKKAGSNTEYNGQFILSEQKYWNQALQAIKEANAILQFPPKKIIGDALEYYLGGVSALSEEVGLEGLKSVTEETFGKLTQSNIEKKVVGGKTYAVGVDYSKFNKEMAEAINQEIQEMHKQTDVEKGRTTHIDLSTDFAMDITSEKVQKSQGKSDVTFVWDKNGTSSTFSAKNLKLSSKGKQEIHLLSGGVFYNLIQDENINFINHYLNIVSLKDLSNGAMLRSYHDTMKLILFIKALTGRGIQGRDLGAADYLIVNKRSEQGEVKILPMSNIIEKANNLTGVVFTNYPDTPGKLKNIRIPGTDNPEDAKRRIANLIASLYYTKISIKLKAGVVFG